MAVAVICANCGAKFRAGKPKCPRCRAVVVAPNPAADAASSRTLQKAAAGLVGIFVLVLGILWIRQDKEPEPTTAQITKAADPLASRRTATAIQPAETIAPVAASERPFMEPDSAGRVAYTDGDLPSALASYRAAVEKNPDDAESWSNLGQVLVRLNKVPEALPNFERAIALAPGRWAYRFNRGRAFSLLGRWDEAIADYRQAQQLFPDDYVTTFNLGLALHKKGDEPSAVTAYQKAISLEPDDASFRMALGISLEKIGKRAEAAEAYKEYLRLSPAAPDAEKIRTRITQLAGPAPAPTGA